MVPKINTEKMTSIVITIQLFGNPFMNILLGNPFDILFGNSFMTGA